MKKRSSRLVALLLLFALVVLPLPAEATLYHIPGASAVTPEDSWYLGALEEYDPKLATLYRLVIDTVREDVETDFVMLDNYGVRKISLDDLPYQYARNDVYYAVDSSHSYDLLTVAIGRELHSLVNYAQLADQDSQGYCHSLWIEYGGWHSHHYYIEEDREKIIEATENLIAEAGITAENVDTLTDYEKALALHDVFLDNVYYSFDDENQTMYGGLVNGYCVCAGYADSYQWLLSQVGIPALYVVGSAGGLHAWNMAKLDGVWYEFDATWDDIKYQALPCRHTYFGLSSDDMGRNHTKAANPLGYPDCPVSLPNHDYELANQTFTVLPTDEEAYALANIWSGKRGGTIRFSIDISEDYWPGEDFTVTVSDGELKETSPFHYEVTGYTSDIQVTVTGLARKPALAESGAFLSVGGNLHYHGTARLGKYSLPADAGELTWYWVVDGKVQDYYRINGEFAERIEWKGEAPYGLYIYDDRFGHDIVLRVKAANYSGFLESDTVTITQKCPTVIKGMPEQYEGNEGGKISFFQGNLKEVVNESYYWYAGVPNMTVRDADGNVCFSYPSESNQASSAWKPTVKGDYTLHVEFGETEYYLGASCDIPVHVYSARQQMNAGRVDLEFSFSGQGIEVKTSGYGPAPAPTVYYCTAFYDDAGRYLGIGYMDSHTYTKFTVPGVQNAASVTVFAVDESWIPVSEAYRKDL